MNELLPHVLFAPLAGLAVLLALAAPFQALLMFDLVLAFLPGNWLIGGVRVDPGDLAIGGLLLAAVLRGRFAAGDRSLLRTAGTWLWLALGVALCVAYLQAPDNQAILTGPLRIGYQLYRYCWKPILYFPLAALLLGDVGRTWLVLDAVLVGGDVCAAMALPQGLHGLRAQGPFDSPNTLGAVLIVPLLIAVAGLISEQGRTRKLLYLASLLLLGRVMLYCGSRGALMAACLGTAVLLWQSLRHGTGRRRLRHLAPWAFAAAAVTIAVHPSVLNGPNVQRFLTLAHPMEEETFRWRMTQRWPHFWAKVEAHPWVGVGTYVDARLGTTANTPHNGYLAIAVMSGLPALALYVALGGKALVRTLRRLTRERRRRGALGAGGGARAAGGEAGTGAPGSAAGRRFAGAMPAGVAAAGAGGGSTAAWRAAVRGTPVPAPAPSAAIDGTAAPRGDWVLDALVAAALAGLLVHNFDDTVVLLPTVSKEYWLLVGLALAPPVAALARAAAGERAAAAEPAPAAAGAAPGGAPAAGVPGRTAAFGAAPAAGRQAAAAGWQPAAAGPRSSATGSHAAARPETTAASPYAAAAASAPAMAGRPPSAKPPAPAAGGARPAVVVVARVGGGAERGGAGR
jgi:O-Antigen ligase